MNTLLWVLQALAALVYGSSGVMKIFMFEKIGISPEGKAIGKFRATGVRPKCSDRLRAAGIQLPANMFEGVVEVR